MRHILYKGVECYECRQLEPFLSNDEPDDEDPPVPASDRENLVWNLSEFEALYRQPCARDPPVQLLERKTVRRETTQK